MSTRNSLHNARSRASDLTFGQGVLVAMALAILLPLALCAVFVLIFPFTLLSALIFMLVWNHGLVALAAAVGLTFKAIGFWTAWWGGWALSLIGGKLFKSRPNLNTRSKS